MDDKNKEIFRALIRMAIKMAKQIEDEDEAEKVSILFPNWENQPEGKELKTGEFYRCGGKLYRVEEDHMLDKNKRPDDDNDSGFRRNGQKKEEVKEENKENKEEENKEQQQGGHQQGHQPKEIEENIEEGNGEE